MRYAILTDIHANLEALEKAVDAAERRGLDQWVVLGDTIGYGANPNECYDWVMQNAAINLMGNHEKALLDQTLRVHFSEPARLAIDWTEQVLAAKYKEHIAKLPYTAATEKVTFVHASLNEPKDFHYLLSFSEAEPSFRLLKTPVCVFGHTHLPTCFEEVARSSRMLPPGTLEMEPGRRYILNPGSVGQPRDRDPRLAFGMLDDEAMTFEVMRLHYDNQRTARKIRTAGLPVYLADRLL